MESALMNLLRELVGTIDYPQSAEASFAAVLATLERLDLFVLETDREARMIRVKCLLDVMNILVWRCWGDKVLIKLVQTDQSKTRISLYGIPNLFRIRTFPPERATTKNEFMAAFTSSIEEGQPTSQ
jgi:hypothetical protein